MVPVNVSPLIRGGRWAALVLGLTYGYQHNKTITEVRRAELAEQAEKARLDGIAAEERKAAEASAPSILQ